MKIKKKKHIGFIYMVRKIYPLCFKAKPSYFIYIHILSIIHAFLFCVAILINQIFFDAVNDAFNGKATLSFAFIMLVVYATTYILRDIIDSVADFSKDTNMQIINGFLNLKIAEKSSLINPLEYENPERLDDINKAANGANSAVIFQNTISVITTFIFHILSSCQYI